MEESGVTNEAGCPSSLIKLEPRKYQLELLGKAKNENVIVFLETGSGKTLIAMLLIDWHAKRIEKPSKKVCIFLAPTVPLVEQQAEVIRSQLNLKVGRYHSRANSSHKTHEQWEEELEKQMVLVMTADILLHKLHHCFIKMEWIELLIFDECHHAHKRHSYAQILKEFYKKDIASCPRIFGMTASPIMGKFRSNQLEYAKGINSLEQLLDATVYTVNDRSELEMFVVPPERQIHYFENKHLLADHITPIQEKLEKCYSKVNI